MARAAPRYACQECGASYRKWTGRCEACGAWNAVVEEAPREAAPGALRGKGGAALKLVALGGTAKPAPRRATGIGEFDRVIGGGLVPGSAILVGGDPGIGKSTLLLQVAAALAEDAGCVFITGEESIEQVRLRASRLGLAEATVALATATNVRDIVATLDAPDGPLVAVIDSIQTMYVDMLDSAPGTVAQVRASAQELIRTAKRRGTAVFLVGHVTKDGSIAGPRVLEHMVDTVLYFEGDRSHQFRILRAVKNRFGPTDEIGVFEMTDRGLIEIANPSSLFLGASADDQAGASAADASGAAIFAGVEGTRPLLVEIQALVAPSAFATPRRAVVGWDGGRLAMVLAVLESRCGLALASRDVYLNVAGGLRIAEPAADLAVAAALVSSLTGAALPGKTVVFGEIGLSGDVRAVSQMDIRIKESKKLGFDQALMPRRAREGGRRAGGFKHHEIAHLRDLIPFFDGSAARAGG